jgi:hypothetical protein
VPSRPRHQGQSAKSSLASCSASASLESIPGVAFQAIALEALAWAGVSKSAVSRHLVALSAARVKEWMVADLSGLDIMVVQIDGIHISEHLVLVAAGSTAKASNTRSD